MSTDDRSIASDRADENYSDGPAINLNPLTLGFSGNDALLETEFLEDYNNASLKQIRSSVIVGALIIAAFSVLDLVVVPADKFYMWGIRCVVLIPVGIFLILLPTWKGMRRYFPAVLSAMLVVTGGGSIAMILRAPAPAAFLYSGGLPLILIFGFTVLRLRFIWGTAVAWAIVLVYSVAVAGSVHTRGIFLLGNAFILGTVNIIGMIASYMIERNTRRDFFLRRQLEKGREHIRQANDRLESRVRERTEILEKVNADLTTEIGGRKLAEDNLQRALNEKEMLLKELQHRVKNNLAIISSLLGLEMRKISDEKSRQVFREAQTRIYSMSTLYDQLFSSGDPGQIDLHGYLEKLTQTVFKTYVVDSDRISLVTDLEHISLDVKRSVPLGLIVNELLTNAVKYAFPEGRAGEIRVLLHEQAGRITLEIADDGVGLAADIDINSSGTMGLPLVKMLCEQLGGEMTISGARGSRISTKFTK